MKLRNKKTGEIHEITEVVPLHDMNKKFIIYSQTEGHNYAYKNLTELNAEWEDYEEPKEYWYIYGDGCLEFGHLTHTMQEEMKTIGNYFETKEEAEKAVEKLKAWKRLKDKGFRCGISGECDNTITYGITITFSDYYDNDETKADLDLLFGGEE